MVKNPYQYIDVTGVIIPDTSEILSDVQVEFRNVFGADLILTPDTPQGVLAAAEALARTEVVNNNAAVANQINPNIAAGIFLDAIMALTGMQRGTATPTVVYGVLLTGVAGTVIPAGTIAKTAAGDQFQSVADVTLSAGGTASVNFRSVATGSVPAVVNTLNSVVTSVLGWETVTNPNTIAPTPGTNTQSDQAARALRDNTLAFQAISLPEAITSALYATKGVTSLKFQENISDSTQTINGISMISHSIYVCIAGGLDHDVAVALLENKSSGCGWNGNTAVVVSEPASGQLYTVLFDRPAQVGILIEVTTPNGSAPDITRAILDYANGTITGLAGFTVGAHVSPFEIAGAIMSELPAIYVKLVRISILSPVSYQPSEIAIGINQQAFTQASYITIIISS